MYKSADTMTDNNNNNNNMIKYGHEVLGRDVTVQFRVGKKKANKTYKGTILRVQISMEDEDERLEQGAAFFKNGREMKLQVLHEVVFSDGEEHWLDLAETESVGRLKWCDNNVVVKESTTPSLQREESTVHTASSSSSSSSDEDSDTAAAKMPEGKKRESSTTTQPTTTATTEKAERRDSGIRVSLKKAKKMRRIMLAQLVAAQAAETDASNDTGGAQVVTPGADQSALKKKKKRSREEPTTTSSSTGGSSRKRKAARKSPARKSPTARKARPQKTPPPENRPGTGPQWVEQMFDWMVTVNGVTPKTALRLRKEVLKLANGEGVTHRQWEDAGVEPFYGGIPVSILTTDMEQLQQDSMDHQHQHGKDPSHGWLLNGPISKLKAFQEYLLTL